MKIFFVCLMIQNTRINPFTLEDNLKRRGFIETVFFLILFKCCKLLQKNFWRAYKNKHQSPPYKFIMFYLFTEKCEIFKLIGKGSLCGLVLT